MPNMDKIFCSKWLSHRQVVFGTKCNKLMVFDVNTRQMDQIPSLSSSENSSPPEAECGIHAIEINPSKTLLATGGRYVDCSVNHFLYKKRKNCVWVFLKIQFQFLFSGGLLFSLLESEGIWSIFLVLTWNTINLLHLVPKTTCRWDNYLEQNILSILAWK